MANGDTNGHRSCVHIMTSVYCVVNKHTKYKWEMSLPCYIYTLAVVVGNVPTWIVKLTNIIIVESRNNILEYGFDFNLVGTKTIKIC